MSSSERGFESLLITGLLVLLGLMLSLFAVLYAIPAEHLTLPDRQSALRMGSIDDISVGGSRVNNWGDEIVLLVRISVDEFYAIQGTSTLDGCILDWDQQAFRVVSPCGHQMYDLRGRAVEGLTTRPLRRYDVSVQRGLVFVTREQG
ncbi:MAG: Rieske (2Fe-2S) protein [Gemmatimonadetes bacterium]|nr:Rieske (2Fe-2S) protein [Gemmatimonadota bacterium]